MNPIRRSDVEGGRKGLPGRVADLALAALAVGPPAFAVLELSTPMLLSRAPTYPELYAAYRHRRPLAAAGVLGGAVLLFRARSGGTDAKKLAKGVAAALAALGASVPLIYDPFLFERRRNGARVLRAQEADGALPEDDTEVAGVRVNGEARAYPLRKIARPHVIYDTLGGERIAITYCGLTNSALVYRPESGHHAPELSVVSAPSDNILYWEECTGTLVQQLLPEPTYGPAKDALVLRPWPAAVTTWEAWRRLAPGTTLGDPPFDSLRDRLVSAVMRRSHIKTRAEEEPFLAVPGGPDRTLHPKARVFGLVEGGEARAYTLGFLEREGAFDDLAGGRPIAVFHDPSTAVALAYRRESDGRDLDFRPAADGGFVDEQTGTRWDVLGRAVSGELAGRELEPVPLSFDKIFWFSWRHYHPETALFRLPDERGEPQGTSIGPA